MASTINCIVCFEKATCFGGHVHKEGEEHLIAGFCKKHFTPRPIPYIDGCKGCHGEWKEQMGNDKYFGAVMFIDKDGLHPLEDES